MRKRGEVRCPVQESAALPSALASPLSPLPPHLSPSVLRRLHSLDLHPARTGHFPHRLTLAVHTNAPNSISA